MDDGVDRLEAAPGPVVVAANWYRFDGGERIHHERVDSRCLLWAVSGSGTVTSRGRSFSVGPGSVLQLPWRHDVDYLADVRTPFRFGTVHVVPEHAVGVPVRPLVAHQPDDPMYDVPERAGGGGVPVLLREGSGSARRLASLVRYTVERFADAAFDEEVARALGGLLVDELDAAHRRERPVLPPDLERMTAFVRRNLDRPIAIDEVAREAGCSSSTAGRLFRTHLGVSVGAWVRDARMAEAAELLRTTGMRVGEVGAAVGFTDPLYFSRVFRAAFGVPPSRYAAGRIRP